MNKKSTLLIIFAVVFSAIIVCFFAWFVTSKLSSQSDLNYLYESVVVDDNQTDMPSEDVQVLETPAPTVDNVPIKAESSHNEPNGKHFYVVIGSFSQVTNAENLVNRLKANYPAAKQLDKYGGLIPVSIADFDSLKKASAYILSENLEELFPGVWVMDK